MSLTEAQTAKLSEYDFYLLGDKSGSMGGPVKAGSSRSRWLAMQETMTAVARAISAIDTDGITIGFFGGAPTPIATGITPEKVEGLFADKRPSGSTPTDTALAAMLAEANKSKKKDFIIVFTDGEPDDQNALAKVIKDQANSQSADDECTILFVQVGDDAGAAKSLAALDDNLKGAKFDIVDAKTLDELEAAPTLEAFLLAAIDD